MGLEVEVVAETNKFDVIVIGGGIAGMTAAAEVQTNGLTSCFLDKDTPGGKLLRIQTIHNSQQFPDMNGVDLSQKYMEYVTEQVKAHYSWGNVQTIRPKNDKFYLFTEDGQTWEAKAIIVATGTINKKLHVPGEEQFINRGVSYCVACDASLTKGKDVVVVGSDYHNNYLKDYANSITTISANDVAEILGNDSVTGIKTKDGNVINCQYVFIENGFISDLSFLPPEVNRNEKNEVIVDENMANAHQGVFACGDCTNFSTKMIDPAINQARIAGLSASTYVKSKHW